VDRLTNTMAVADANPAGYDAVFMTGGHGVCFDFPKSAPLAEVFVSKRVKRSHGATRRPVRPGRRDRIQL
jgi:putative intracellular protease/amidase